MAFDHEKLDVCQLALDFLVMAEEVSEHLPRGRGHIQDQLARASTSTVLNLAEGAGKFSGPDKRRYYLSAVGSAALAFPGFESGARPVYAFGNIELVSEKHADYWMAGISDLRRRYPDRFLMASIMADGGAREDWVELARRAQDAGACAVELNFSCPHGGMPPHAVGAAIGQDTAIAARITRWVREAVRCPVWDCVRLEPVPCLAWPPAQGPVTELRGAGRLAAAMSA